jgi:hypothetical protein
MMILLVAPAVILYATTWAHWWYLPCLCLPSVLLDQIKKSLHCGFMRTSWHVLARGFMRTSWHVPLLQLCWMYGCNVHDCLEHLQQHQLPKTLLLLLDPHHPTNSQTGYTFKQLHAAHSVALLWCGSVVADVSESPLPPGGLGEWH